MKVLDLDMDYFMEHIACIPFSVSDRLDEDNYGDTVWSEERVRNFLENNWDWDVHHPISYRVLFLHCLWKLEEEFVMTMKVLELALVTICFGQ